MFGCSCYLSDQIDRFAAKLVRMVTLFLTCDISYMTSVKLN